MLIRVNSVRAFAHWSTCPTLSNPENFNGRAVCLFSRLLLIALVTGTLGLRDITPFLAQHMPTPESPREAANFGMWKWEATPRNQIDSSNFLFGGTLVDLQRTVPKDVTLDMSIPEVELRFGQWQYGDYESARVAILLVNDPKSQRTMYLDRNRDRRLTIDERVTTRTVDGQAWLTELDAEVHENNKVARARRQIGITRTQKDDQLRIVSLGQVVGVTSLANRTISVARVDVDGNGLTTDIRDQIWLDLNDDGEFDLISERFNVRSWLDVEGTRYSVRSDRLGQQVRLTPNNEQGTVEFEFRLADESAHVETLEGTLRDENGMVVAVRSSRGTISVPAGHYTLNALVLQVRDNQGEIWKMTLSGSESQTGSRSAQMSCTSLIC